MYYLCSSKNTELHRYTYHRPGTETDGVNTLYRRCDSTPAFIVITLAFLFKKKEKKTIEEEASESVSLVRMRSTRMKLVAIFTPSQRCRWGGTALIDPVGLKELQTGLAHHHCVLH